MPPRKGKAKKAENSAPRRSTRRSKVETEPEIQSTIEEEQQPTLLNSDIPPSTASDVVSGAEVIPNEPTLLTPPEKQPEEGEDEVSSSSIGAGVSGILQKAEGEGSHMDVEMDSAESKDPLPPPPPPPISAPVPVMTMEERQAKLEALRSKMVRKKAIHCYYFSYTRFFYLEFSV